jgi:phenylpyruvate tautomerase PptA (4-oxalocrotonate tautomerase family)
MPLIRIDVMAGRRTPEQLRTLADTIHEVVLETMDAPARDRYQIITEHAAGQMIIEDTGLGFERTEDVVFVQVFQQGRDADQKTALYAGLADRLAAETGLRGEDLVVSLSANTKEDWSFGNGRAQFLEGDL